MYQNMSILPSMTFHTESVGTAKLTRQSQTGKHALIQINNIPVLAVECPASFKIDTI